ncbi:hypothetical protein AAVH_30035 [Aphelenchoides avenae]|nr:hypothetical protein AAVH_30035 [Aphelenchus avenae]
MEEELVAERVQVKSATDKERDFHEKTLAEISKRDELVTKIKKLEEKLRERDTRIRQMEKELKDKKQREDVTRKNAHAAATAAGSQASAEQKSAVSRASTRGKQNASQATSQSASAPEFQAPAAKTVEQPATSTKRSAMHPIPIAHSTPVASHLHAAAASPREPKRTKDSFKASAAASLKARAVVLTVTPRACTSLQTGTSDNKEYECCVFADCWSATNKHRSAGASSSAEEAERGRVESGAEIPHSAVRNVYHEFRRQLVPPGILCRLLLPSIIVAFDRPAAIRFARVHIVHDSFTHEFGKKYSALGVYLPSEFGIKVDLKVKVEAHTRYYKPLEKCAAEERRRFARDERDFEFPFQQIEKKMPPRLKSRIKDYCPTVSDEMTKFFDFEPGTTPDRYEAAIRARVEGSDYVYWRNQFDTSDAFGNLIRQRRAYKELSEADDRDEEDNLLATIRPDDARPLVRNKQASAQRKDKHIPLKMRVERTFQDRTMRLTQRDATGAPAANATATQAVPQNIARLDGAEAEPGPSILKRRPKVNFSVDNDVEDGDSANAPGTTPKRRPAGVGAVNQVGPERDYSLGLPLAVYEPNSQSPKTRVVYNHGY